MGYGATHSQSLEKIFFGIPNVTVISPTQYHNPGQLLLNAYLSMETPIIFIENKALYSKKLVITHKQKQGDFFADDDNTLFPTIRLIPENDIAEATIICYGGSIDTALAASWRLIIDEEINTEIICPSLISPLPIDSICSLISDKSKIIIIVDEGYQDYAWSTEVALSIIKRDRKKNIDRPVENLGMKGAFISSSKLIEEYIYPSVFDILEKIKQLIVY